MRWLLFLIVVFALHLIGCGYVGDPLPPALNIPVAIQDLRAVQRGSTIYVDFTLPTLTTEQLTIRRIGAVDLRIGASGNAFDLGRWAEAAKPIPVGRITPGPVSAAVPARDWTGKEVVIAARMENTRGRYSGWSNLATVQVAAPLSKPGDLQADSDPGGVRLSWRAPDARSGLQYRVYRSSDETKERALLGTVDQSEFIDRTAVYGKRYRYSVQATGGNVESEDTAEAEVTPVDKFAPAVPSGITGIAGLNSIELAWERNTEPDLRGYRVYRAEGNGPFSVLADFVETPFYSDKAIASGKQYRYAVSSTDQGSNESAKSAAIEMRAP